MTITTRAGKGSALTHAEMDENFTDLRDGIDAKVPKTKGTGIKVDSTGTPTFGWHDLIGNVFVPDPAGPTAPTYNTYIGGLKQYQFTVGDEVQATYHLPHDFLPASQIFIHVHWSHNSTLVTGGSVTWGFELTYSKGHNQAPFSAPINIVEVQNGSTTQYQHLVCEAPASVTGGGANLLDSDLLEPDGVIIGRVYLVANNLTVSSGPVPEVFFHTADIHYQSTNVPTKNRLPDFWT